MAELNVAIQTGPMGLFAFLVFWLLLVFLSWTRSPPPGSQAKRLDATSTGPVVVSLKKYKKEHFNPQLFLISSFMVNVILIFAFTFLDARGIKRSNFLQHPANL